MWRLPARGGRRWELRAGFRFLCPKGRGGSSPPSPTPKVLVRRGAAGPETGNFYRISTGPAGNGVWGRCARRAMTPLSSSRMSAHPPPGGRLVSPQDIQVRSACEHAAPDRHRLGKNPEDVLLRWMGSSAREPASTTSTTSIDMVTRRDHPFGPRSCGAYWNLTQTRRLSP